MDGHVVPPPDGGAAAWVRVGAYALVCIATLGVQYSFSPFYALLLEELASPPAATAFVGSLSIGLMDGLACFSGMIIERFGARLTCLAGAVLASAGMAASAAASSLVSLYLTYGLLVGCGSSLAFMSPIVLMSRWFTKRLALAHAVANMASALMPLAFGSSSTLLFAAIGRRSAMLYLAALQLLLLGGASAVLTPPKRRVARGGAPDAASSSTQAACNAATLNASATLAANTAAANANREEDRATAAESTTPFRSAVRDRTMQLVMLSAMLYGMGAWIPVVHLVRLGIECGLADADAALMLTFLAVGSFMWRVPVACAADALGRRAVFAVCALLYAALCVAGALAVGTPNEGLCAPASSNASGLGGGGGAGAPASAFFPPFAFGCGLVGGMNTISVTLPSEIGLPAAQARAGTTIMASCLGVGFLLGPIIAGGLHGMRNAYREPLLFGALMLAAAAAASVVSLRRTPPPRQSRPLRVVVK